MDRRRLILSAIALALVLGACSGPTTPDESVALAVATDPSGNVASPVKISARAINAGWTPVWHYQGCGAGIGIGVQVLDSAGNELLLHDPSMMPACWDGIVALGPAKELTLSTSFVGTMFVRGENGYEAAPVPPGDYVLRITFAYSRNGSPPDVVLEETRSFRWLPPPPAP